MDTDLNNEPAVKKKRGNPQNLKPFPKGVSGNPAGRVKGSRNRGTILQEMMELNLKSKNVPKELRAVLKKLPPGYTIEDAIDATLLKLAIKYADISAIKEIKDTLHGKIKEVQQIIPPSYTPEEIASMSKEEAAAAYDRLTKF